MKYDKDKIKNSLTMEQVFQLVAELGGAPRPTRVDNMFIAQTICHNHPGEGSYKLYYYDNTKLFKCYTDCSTTFDIFELIIKASDHKKNLTEAMKYVINFFNLEVDFENGFTDGSKLEDWNVIRHYEKNLEKEKVTEQTVEFKTIDKNTLKFFPTPRIIPWEKEGISKEVIQKRGICYNPSSQSIIIPHYDINNTLIGIRERTLVEDNEQYGKYKPAILNGKMYNHPLGFNLYNLNNSKENIKIIKKAIILEGEKSTLKYASFFGIENDISCAVCGSALINYQVKLLLSLGVEEIIIGFDKQFQVIGDAEWKTWTNKLKDIHARYGTLCQISFLFDKEDLLKYKDSPVDEGPDIFLQLFKNRIFL